MKKPMTLAELQEQLDLIEKDRRIAKTKCDALIAARVERHRRHIRRVEYFWDGVLILTAVMIVIMVWGAI